MSAQTITLIVTIVYLLVMVVVGVWANRHMHSAKEFLVAGQSLGFFVMAVASFSSIQSGWGMVGSTGTTFGWGVQSLVAGPLFAPIGFALAWFLLGTRLRRAAQRHQLYSIPDIIRVRYKSKSAHISMSVAMLLGAIGYMTAQIVATGVITSLLLGVPFTTGAWIGSLIVAAYTIAGGMLAAVWTDLIQGVVMIAVSVGVFVLALGSGGGWGSLLDTLAAADPGLLSVAGTQPATWVGASALMIVLGMVAQPQLIHKFLMLRSTRDLRWGALVAGVGYFTTTLFILGVGVAMRAAVIDGRVAEPANLDAAATDFLSALTHPVVAGLALTCLLAAIMSSASSFITIGASAIMRDLTGGLGIRVRRELLWGRVCSMLIVLAALGVGLYLDQIIYLLGAIGWAAFGGAIFGPVIIGIYWRRATGTATTAAIVSGLVFNVAATFLTARGYITPPGFFFTGGVTVALSILVFVFASYVTRSADDVRRFAQLYPDAAALPADGPAEVRPVRAEGAEV